MDSFYDAPRKPPTPTTVEKYPIVPMVPEVSLVCPSKAPYNQQNTYKSWRTSANVRPLSSNKDNIINGQQNSFLRKQVRFESPGIQNLPHQYGNFNIKDNENNHPLKPTVQNDAFDKRKTFEEIYMANIPNRHLDLSIVDLNTVSRRVQEHQHSPVEVIECKENELPKAVTASNQKDLPKTYKEFLETQKKVTKAQELTQNDSVTDIFNYRSDKQFNVPRTEPTCKPVERALTKQCQNKTDFVLDSIRRGPVQDELKFKENINMPVHHHCCHSSNVKEKLDSEPTNRDLLKIIAQQNEQLLILQKQVAMLLNRDQNKMPCIEPRQEMKNHLPDLQKMPLNDINNTPKKRGMSKFSIDLMTSFEVAIRPQNKQNFNYEPKIQEVTEIESTTDNNDINDKMHSLHLKEPFQVAEQCPSPEPSININMNDFDNSSSDEEISASDIGETFYRNLMSQVNNILKKAQIQTREDMIGKTESQSRENPNKTMLRVKEATLKHLKSIGVSVDNLDDDSVGSDDGGKEEYSPTEVSFAVKQLLMKYLPDDQLTKITQKKNVRAQVDGNHAGIMPIRPEFSFASLQYMKKYNLIQTTESNSRNRIVERKQSDDNQKILDLTTLKMQPKLL